MGRSLGAQVTTVKRPCGLALGVQRCLAPSPGSYRWAPRPAPSVHPPVSPRVSRPGAAPSSPMALAGPGTLPVRVGLLGASISRGESTSDPRSPLRRASPEASGPCPGCIHLTLPQQPCAPRLAPPNSPSLLPSPEPLLSPSLGANLPASRKSPRIAPSFAFPESHRSQGWSHPGPGQHLLRHPQSFHFLTAPSWFRSEVEAQSTLRAELSHRCL